MARINVSVPDSLRERMSALDSKVNWSEVAQAAFEREVSNRTFKGEDMDSVIDRLRTSKAEFVQKEAARGLRDGTNWAQRLASYEDLRRVASLRFGEMESYAWQFDEGTGHNPSQGDSFWINEDTGRIDAPADEYVEAFCSGATDVWDTVKDKI